MPTAFHISVAFDRYAIAAIADSRVIIIAGFENKRGPTISQIPMLCQDVPILSGRTSRIVHLEQAYGHLSRQPDSVMMHST